jgi:hypothetical protein
MRIPPLSLFPALKAGADLRMDRSNDDGLVVEMIRTGALFGDFSLERWLDRVERREERP